MTRAGSIAALGLIAILLSGCAHGLTPLERQKSSPSSDFLNGVADEYEASIHGAYTKEVIKEWVAQNEP